MIGRVVALAINDAMREQRAIDEWRLNPLSVRTVVVQTPYQRYRIDGRRGWHHE